MSKRLKNFFIVTILATFLMLFYVHQNIEIIRLGYSVQENKKALSSFLDQHKRLVFNLNTLESPALLGKRLCEAEIRLVETDVSNIYYANAAFSNKDIHQTEAGMGILARVFDAFTAKAEARGRK